MTLITYWSHGHKTGRTMPRAFTDEERKQISQRLLEAGQKQFTAYGLKKTNVEELAAAAGISKGAFYLFYDSKEALLKDLMEQAEVRYRQEVLAVVDSPGLSARDRLYTVLKTAFTLWKTLPILQLFARSDYALLSRQIPLEQLQQHLMNDQRFVQELITRCRAAGIPIVATVEQLTGLFYIVLFATLHERDLGSGSFHGALDLLLELIIAFCLGEVTILMHNPAAFVPSPSNEASDDSGD